MLSIQVVATGRCKHTHHLHSLAGSRHLGWLYILVIGTNAAEIWECIYAFEILSLVPLHIPRNGIDVFQLLNRVSQFGIPWTASMQVFLVLHYRLESAQSHVHSVSDAIPTISSFVAPFSSHIQSFPAHQGLCQWVSSLHHVTNVLELQLQHQSFQWIFRVDLL